MSKKKKEKDNEELIEDAKTEDVKTESQEVNVNKMTLDMFVKSYKTTSGKNNSYAAGFKAWWLIQADENKYSRMPFSDWEVKFKEYLASPVK